MDIKQWAVIFVALLSFDYASATFFYAPYKGVEKSYDNDGSGYGGWSGGCRCNRRVTSHLDGILENIKVSLGKYNGISVRDHNLEEYEFTNGNVKGFDKFERRGPYRCSLSRDYVRVYFRIGFVRLVIHYTVNLVEDILGGFLGGIASIFGRILGHVTDFLFRIACPDVDVTVVLIQRFTGGGGFEVEGLYLGNIENVSFLDKRFSKHQKSFGPYFRPVCDHALRGVFHENVTPVIGKHCRKVTVTRKDFYYESESQNEYEEDEEYSDDE